MEIEVEGRDSPSVDFDSFGFGLRSQLSSLILFYFLRLNHEFHLPLAHIIEVIALDPMLAPKGLHPGG
jgi:hypothetical protein